MADVKKIPRLNYTLICDDVRQELGGKFSLMGLFESISAAVFPATHHRFAIVNEWAGGRGEFTATIRLIAPDREQVISETTSRFQLFNESQRHRDISVRFNTTFKVPGTYWVETLLDGERAGIIALPVQMITEQTVH